MSPKVIIAKSGFNALTETDPNNLVFSSDYNTFKYEVSGSTSFVIPSSATAISGDVSIYTHDLDYYPLFFVYIKDDNFTPNRYYQLPYSFADAGVYDHRFVFTTTSEIIFRYSNSGFASNVNVTVYYKIFKNNLGF